MKQINYMAGVVTIILFLFPITLCSAQTSVSFETNCLRIGDSLKVKEFPYVDAGDGGINMVWDFSFLPQEREYMLFLKADTLDNVILIGKADNQVYRLSSDSLLMIGYENPQTRIVYERPQVPMVYPLRLGDRHHSSFEGKGQYCGRHYLWRKGTISTEADGEGILILEEGDTLKNVLRVYSLTTASVRLSEDSVLTDSATYQQYIEEKYWWYARGYRYPVFEITTNTLYHEMQPVYTEQWARKPELTTACAVSDTLNSDILKNDSLYNVIQSREDIISYTLTNENNHLTISYDLSAHARIHVIVADIMGMTYRNESTTQEAGQSYNMNIDLNGLRCGQYIVYINVNGKIYNHKTEVR